MKRHHIKTQEGDGVRLTAADRRVADLIRGVFWCTLEPKTLSVADRVECVALMRFVMDMDVATISRFLACAPVTVEWDLESVEDSRYPDHMLSPATRRYRRRRAIVVLDYVGTVSRRTSAT